MSRQKLPKIIIFLMIFNLITLQAYPFSVALAADPGTEMSEADVAKQAAEDEDKEAADKKEADEAAADKKEADEKEAAEKAAATKQKAAEEAAAEKTSEVETAPVDTKIAVATDDNPNEETEPATDALVTDVALGEEVSQTEETESAAPAEEATVSAPILSGDGDPGVTPGTEGETANGDVPAVEPQASGAVTPEADMLNTSASAEVSVINMNDTTAENVSVAVSDTGGNGAENYSDAVAMDATTTAPENTAPPVEASPDSAAITTGDAESVTVIENNINTNVTTENGVVSNADIYDYTGDIDLLTVFVAVLAGAKGIVTLGGDAINIVIKNINNAVVENQATTASNTGNNSATGDSASITTGEATATTDIVNYVNTNIVGNNWLYATLNIFGNWNGNLIVPGEGLLSALDARNFSTINIFNENSATVTNDVLTVANTGDNSATSGGAGEVNIQSGSSLAQTNISNVVDTNIVRNNWFLLLFNNMGSWTGQLLNWGGESNNVLSYNFGGAYTEFPSGTLSVTNQNEAQVTNSAVTTANSGGNTASGNFGGAKVTTGNASAFTNIFNMINTNIIGDNWFFAVVNNMGNWNGNVEFGYPDLAVALVSDQAEVSPGETVDFAVHYKNIGQADSGATQVRLQLPAELSAEKTVWDITGLKSGAEGSLQIKAQVKSDADAGATLKSTVEISTETKEVNVGNNSDSDETGVYDARAASLDSLDSKLVVKRSSTVTDQAKPGDRVQNTIIVENKSDNSLYNVSVSDKMLIADGTKLADFVWPIGKIKKGDKVRIRYEFIVNNPGQEVAVNYVAKAIGQDMTGQEVSSHKASNWLTVLGFVARAYAVSDEETPIVAGLETENSTPASSVLQNDPVVPLGWPFWLWLTSVVAYSLYALRNRLLVAKRLTG